MLAKGKRLADSHVQAGFMIPGRSGPIATKAATQAPAPPQHPLRSTCSTRAAEAGRPNALATAKPVQPAQPAPRQAQSFRLHVPTLCAKLSGLHEEGGPISGLCWRHTQHYALCDTSRICSFLSKCFLFSNRLISDRAGHRSS